MVNLVCRVCLSPQRSGAVRTSLWFSPLSKTKLQLAKSKKNTKKSLILSMPFYRIFERSRVARVETRKQTVEVCYWSYIGFP